MTMSPEHSPTEERVNVTVSKEIFDRFALFVEYIKTREDMSEETKTTIETFLTDTDLLLDKAVESFIDGLFDHYFDFDKPPIAE